MTVNINKINILKETEKKQTAKIPFNKPSIVGNELSYIKQAVESGKISGDGDFTTKCHDFIQARYGVKKALLTTSCSSALDMTAILAGIKKEDEVIMPSFNFVSAANSFYIRNATIRFAEIREDTLNIDEDKIEEAINPFTRAIVLIHYAGVSCEMDKIVQIARNYNLILIEDAAHAIEAKYKDSYLGSIGNLGCYSFHETKNVICGEGGALLLNDESFFERAEIIREKGTNRSKFFRGEVDKYSWVDIGSSFLPSEVLSAFLYAQFEKIYNINKKRSYIWNHYYENLEIFQKKGLLRLPVIPDNCTHNSHIFYILLNDLKTRNDLMDHFKRSNIIAVFHFLPLHLSPMGAKLGYRPGDFPVTEDVSDRILRLPLFYDLNKEDLDRIIKVIKSFFKDDKNSI